MEHSKCLDFIMIGPSWPYVVKTCLSHEHLAPTAIMSQFGAFIPGIKGDDTPTLMTDGCGNLQCRQNCFNSADLRFVPYF